MQTNQNVESTFATLDRELLSEFVPWTIKIEHIDDAFRKGIITDALLAANLEPDPHSFGLRSSLVPLPVEVENLAKRYYFIWVAALFFAFTYVIRYLGLDNVTNLRIEKLSLIGWLFLAAWPFAIMFLLGEWLYCEIRSLIPVMQKYDQYQAACRRYHCLNRVRSYLAYAKEARSWLTADGPTFEGLVAHYFRAQGYHVEALGGANDGGVDLRVAKEGERAIVQCKAYANPLGPAIVRELYGTLQHEGAQRAYLATLNGISRNARVFCVGKPISVLKIDDFVATH